MRAHLTGHIETLICPLRASLPAHGLNLAARASEIQSIGCDFSPWLMYFCPSNLKVSEITRTGVGWTLRISRYPLVLDFSISMLWALVFSASSYPIWVPRNTQNGPTFIPSQQKYFGCTTRSISPGPFKRTSEAANHEASISSEEFLCFKQRTTSASLRRASKTLSGIRTGRSTSFFNPNTVCVRGVSLLVWYPLAWKTNSGGIQKRSTLSFQFTRLDSILRISLTQTPGNPSAYATRRALSPPFAFLRQRQPARSRQQQHGQEPFLLHAQRGFPHGFER
jgi:hypothetical protein